MAKNVRPICPLMGSECIEDGTIKDGELVGCRFWVTIQGKNPQTGEITNDGDCTMAWMPLLLVENSKVNRETGSAIESFRNEMVYANHHTANILLSSIKNEKLLTNDN